MTSWISRLQRWLFSHPNIPNLRKCSSLGPALKHYFRVTLIRLSGSFCKVSFTVKEKDYITIDFEGKNNIALHMLIAILFHKLLQAAT